MWKIIGSCFKRLLYEVILRGNLYFCYEREVKLFFESKVGSRVGNLRRMEKFEKVKIIDCE